MPCQPPKRFLRIGEINKNEKDILGRCFSKTPEYKSFYAMKSRCINPKNPAFKYYGMRGIKICERWIGKDGFENFLNDMGNRPTLKHTLDRINNGGNYEPSNCRWTTRKIQVMNSRNATMLTFNGETRNQSEWAELLGISQSVISKRLQHGWSVNDALTKPSDLTATLKEWKGEA